MIEPGGFAPQINEKDTNDTEHPACYGDLDTVFPIGKEGLRQSPESCLFCHYKTACLKTAMEDTHKGLEAKEEYVDRAYESGMMGFLNRWSKKKYLKKQMNENRSNPERK